MRIEFNRVTWYSKLSAVLFFLLAMPILTFYIGMKYQETTDVLSTLAVPVQPYVPHVPKPSVTDDQPNTNQIQTFEVQLGKTVSVFGTEITPIKVLEDSRCPANVLCIQAGTIRLQTRVKGAFPVSENILILNKVFNTESAEITLTDVTPYPIAGQSISPKDYNFIFKVQKHQAM